MCNRDKVTLKYNAVGIKEKFQKKENKFVGKFLPE